MAHEREAERKRIARELHDTLLQGLQGVLLEIDAFLRSSVLTDEDHERAADIEKKLRRIVAEGRDAINALRSPDDERDWVAAIVDAGNRLSVESKIGFSLHIEGDPRNLRAKVRSEVLEIIRESLRNAFEHSGGNVLTVRLGFRPTELFLEVQDDGNGIDPDILKARRKPGHWGLIDMRERAGQISAKLLIESQPGQGTRVALSVPGPFAYATPPINGLFSRIQFDVRQKFQSMLCHHSESCRQDE